MKSCDKALHKMGDRMTGNKPLDSVWYYNIWIASEIFFAYKVMHSQKKTYGNPGELKTLFSF